MKRAFSAYPAPLGGLLAGLSIPLVVASSALGAGGGALEEPAPEHEAGVPPICGNPGIEGVPPSIARTRCPRSQAHPATGSKPPRKWDVHPHKALRLQGIALHGRALEGDEEAAGEAVERLERHLERFSEDGEARAYLGSAYALMGRDASSVVNKMRYTNRGLRHLDRALDLAPRDFAVRYVRARVNAGLPKMFSRGEAAIEDMRALDAIFHESPSPGRARWMIDIYEDLADLAPDAGPWAERLARARALAAGS